MSCVYCNVYSGKLSYKLSFDKRINIIKGDSGTGKTTLVDLIDASSYDNDIEVDCNLHCKVGRVDTLDLLISSEKNCIIFIDEVHFKAYKNFSSMYSNYAVSNNLFFILITREESVLDDVSNFFQLSFSVSNIFKMCSDGFNHWIEQLYVYNSHEGVKDF